MGTASSSARSAIRGRPNLNQVPQGFCAANAAITSSARSFHRSAAGSGSNAGTTPSKDTGRSARLQSRGIPTYCQVCQLCRTELLSGTTDGQVARCPGRGALTVGPVAPKARLDVVPRYPRTVVRRARRSVRLTRCGRVPNRASRTRPCTGRSAASARPRRRVRAARRR